MARMPLKAPARPLETISKSMFPGPALIDPHSATQQSAGRTGILVLAKIRCETSFRRDRIIATWSCPGMLSCLQVTIQVIRQRTPLQCVPVNSLDHLSLGLKREIARAFQRSGSKVSAPTLVTVNGSDRLPQGRY